MTLSAAAARTIGSGYVLGHAGQLIDDRKNQMGHSDPQTFKLQARASCRPSRRKCDTPRRYRPCSDSSISNRAQLVRASSGEVRFHVRSRAAAGESSAAGPFPRRSDRGRSASSGYWSSFCGRSPALSNSSSSSYAWEASATCALFETARFERLFQPIAMRIAASRSASRRPAAAAPPRDVVDKQANMYAARR